VTSSFELFVARRYLQARRKQTFVSVITAISIIGVAAGTLSLVVALAITNGFRNTLQANLLGATAHVSILEKEPGNGIANWRELTRQMSAIPGVTNAAASLYGSVLFVGPLQSMGGILKGIDLASSGDTIDILKRLKEGSIKGLEPGPGLPGILLGSKLARNTGMSLNSVITVLSPQGELTPFGPRLAQHRFRVVGLFESGFYEIDANWAFTSLQSTQNVLAVDDVVNAIELKVADIQRAEEVALAADPMIGKQLAATTWKEQNRPILAALGMERIVTVVVIGLIQLVAALNILIALIMMVMEKHRDIAILMSMGARQAQIRKIFMFQGVLIGVVGSVVGLVLGYAICYLADRYRWLRLDEEVYSLAYVPFDPRWVDGIWIAGVAIAVSFLATIYPARAASRIAPVEALRYE
jgi:lipoprotein-releasing system permease protein